MLNKMETAALKHVMGELQYRKSPQAKRDAEADKIRRAEADKTAGHLPTCGLLRCDPACKHS